MQAAVYILTNKVNGTLYIGVTADLTRRMWQHRNDATPGFASRHGCYRLVHFEMFGSIDMAIAREKQLKAGSRQRKVDLIRQNNPGWRDLFTDMCR